MKESAWEGVRNYEARNIMRDQMKLNDMVLFYHSNCKEPGIAGIAQVSKESYVDHTAFDPSSAYYDPKSVIENPKWFMVNLKFVKKLDRFLPLKELQGYQELANMVLIRRGRLSVQPVLKSEFEFILKKAVALE